MRKWIACVSAKIRWGLQVPYSDKIRGRYGDFSYGEIGSAMDDVAAHRDVSCMYKVDLNPKCAVHISGHRQEAYVVFYRHHGHVPSGQLRFRLTCVQEHLHETPRTETNYYQ